MKLIQSTQQKVSLKCCHVISPTSPTLSAASSTHAHTHAGNHIIHSGSGDERGGSQQKEGEEEEEDERTKDEGVGGRKNYQERISGGDQQSLQPPREGRREEGRKDVRMVDDDG